MKRKLRVCVCVCVYNINSGEQRIYTPDSSLCLFIFHIYNLPPHILESNQLLYFVFFLINFFLLKVNCFTEFCFLSNLNSFGNSLFIKVTEANLNKINSYKMLL